MTDDTIIVGLGQEAAGDDAVGLVVARALSARGIRALASADASVIVTLLSEGTALVVVDAVVCAGQPGAVLQLSADDLAEGRAQVSSHGLGLVEALALASVLYGRRAPRMVDIVGIVIDAPIARGAPLSPGVARAVDAAAALATRLAQGRDHSGLRSRP